MVLCTAHAGRRGIYCTLWIATIVLGDVDFAKQKSKHHPSGFRWAKESAFIYRCKNTGYIHTMKEQVYIFP